MMGRERERKEKQTERQIKGLIQREEVRFEEECKSVRKGGEIELRLIKKGTGMHSSSEKQPKGIKR